MALLHIRDGQIQLLHQLADEAVLRRFALFPLAAGEFPQVGVGAALAPLTQQDAAVFIIYNACGYLNHA